MRKIPFAGIELTSQRVRGLRGTSELPGRSVLCVIPLFLSFMFLKFLLPFSRWGFVDLSLIFSCLIQQTKYYRIGNLPRILLCMVEARSVNVNITLTHTHTHTHAVHLTLSIECPSCTFFWHDNVLCVIPFFLSFMLCFVSVAMLSLELCRCPSDLFLSNPVDHLLPDCQLRMLLGKVEARSVNVRNTHTHTHTQGWERGRK